MNENRKAPAPPRRKRRRRPGKFRRALHALSRAVLLLLLTAAAIVMMTIFFKVNTISVEGAEKYSVEEITNALDISKGDNLYLWNKMKVQEHLLEKLPYLDSVRIRRHLPDALVLTVTECHAAAAVKAEDGSYYYISSTGKILEQSTSDGGGAGVPRRGTPCPRRGAKGGKGTVWFPCPLLTPPNPPLHRDSLRSRGETRETGARFRVSSSLWVAVMP